MNEQSAIFDIPALLGKGVDEVLGILKQQAQEIPEAAQLRNSDDTFISFVKDGWDLQVHYTKSSKVVREFWLGRAAEPFKFKTNEKERFAQAGNLSENAAEYRIQFDSIAGSVGYYDTAMIIPS